MFYVLPLVFVLLLAFTSNAAPLVAEKRGIQADLLRELKLMEQYASAAYCPGNTNSPGDEIKCGSGNCPLVQEAGAKSVGEFSRLPTPTDVTGFLAVDHTNRLITLSFRGSTTPESWLTNLDVALTPTYLCPSCTAHRGFWTSWLDARDRVVPLLTQAAAAYPDYGIAVTGHSLGGAIATLAAAQLRSQGWSVGMYSFGAPRVGGRELSAFISGQEGGNYRVTHRNDPVPKLPLLLMGFVHVSPEYYVDAVNGAEVGTKDVQLFRGAVSFGGNGKWVGVDVEAHRWYFGRVYGCEDRVKRTVREWDVVGRF